jgi:hypothetical protein
MNFSPQSPIQGAQGSDTYSRRMNMPKAGNPLLWDVMTSKKVLNQSETLLSYGGKGAIPLDVNLYFSGKRVDYYDNINGNTRLGPGWVLNYEMTIMQIIGCVEGQSLVYITLILTNIGYYYYRC